MSPVENLSEKEQFLGLIKSMFLNRGHAEILRGKSHINKGDHNRRLIGQWIKQGHREEAMFNHGWKKVDKH